MHHKHSPTKYQISIQNWLKLNIDINDTFKIENRKWFILNKNNIKMDKNIKMKRILKIGKLYEKYNKGIWHF